MAKWVRFEEQDAQPERKTQVIRVLSAVRGEVVGEIKWHGAWRTYCFFPSADTLFEDTCLVEIAEMVEVMTRAHWGIALARSGRPKSTKGAQADGT